MSRQVPKHAWRCGASLFTRGERGCGSCGAFDADKNTPRMFNVVVASEGFGCVSFNLDMG